MLPARLHLRRARSDRLRAQAYPLDRRHARPQTARREIGQKFDSFPAGEPVVLPLVWELRPNLIRIDTREVS